MNSKDNLIEEATGKTKNKTKAFAILGCSGSIFLGIIVILLSGKMLLDYIFTPEETLIKTIPSPNDEYTIELYRIDEFPDPSLKIKYGNRYIIKQNTSVNQVSIEWKNDKKADVIVDKRNETKIERKKFKLLRLGCATSHTKPAYRFNCILN